MLSTKNSLHQQSDCVYIQSKDSENINRTLSWLLDNKRKLEQKMIDKASNQIALLRSKCPIVDFEPRDAMELNIQQVIRLNQTIGCINKLKQQHKCI